MKVNRVFCYSKKVAKQNGNNLPILGLILSIVLGMVAIFVYITFMDSSFNEVTFTLFFIGWMSLIIYYSVIIGLRLKSRMTGYATDINGRIYKVMMTNNGQGLYIGGVAAGRILDQLASNTSGLGESLGGAAGAAAQIYAINKSANYMSHPEIVANIVETMPNVTGAEVIEILNIYSISDRKKSIKIQCDYKISRYDKVKYNKKLVIEKSFNMFEDLMNVLNTHKQ